MIRSKLIIFGGKLKLHNFTTMWKRRLARLPHERQGSEISDTKDISLPMSFTKKLGTLQPSQTKHYTPNTTQRLKWRLYPPYPDTIKSNLTLLGCPKLKTAYVNISKSTSKTS